ncbi:hypothetical protein PI95_001185 [Hassallia byssoidea VB512170]|uniref:Uncharacterized protein n=1 Tax=Hassallia byssoidea VB512170 TaxID=1304833 RepID=A0A846H243_9CYAN|nr:hypothetical protein [Hassalia byssoidea]NEU71228.1 hypothetical protein [Hassalia byssoidea VB512170]
MYRQRDKETRRQGDKGDYLTTTLRVHHLLQVGRADGRCSTWGNPKTALPPQRSGSPTIPQPPTTNN